MSERKPELVIVDALRDRHGRTVKAGWRGSDVEIIVTPHSGHDGRISLDGEQRDRFIKAWAEAERRAEAIADRAAFMEERAIAAEMAADRRDAIEAEL